VLLVTHVAQTALFEAGLSQGQPPELEFSEELFCIPVRVLP